MATNFLQLEPCPASQNVYRPASKAKSCRNISVIGFEFGFESDLEEHHKLLIVIETCEYVAGDISIFVEGGDSEYKTGYIM